MGFTITNERNGSQAAFMVLEKTLQLPEVGEPTTVLVRFFPESRNWKRSIQPLSENIVTAKQLPSGCIKLSKRILHHNLAHPDAGDIVVEIVHEGKSLLLSKAKYEDSEALGISKCRNGWFIDEIRHKPV
jgi:hypothetical protein